MRELETVRPKGYLLPSLIHFAAIPLIAEDRTADLGQLDANLMRPARLQLDVQQAERIDGIQAMIG